MKNEIEKQIRDAIKDLNKKYEGTCTFKLGDTGIKITNIPEERHYVKMSNMNYYRDVTLEDKIQDELYEFMEEMEKKYECKMEKPWTDYLEAWVEKDYWPKMIKRLCIPEEKVDYKLHEKILEYLKSDYSNIKLLEDLQAK